MEPIRYCRVSTDKQAKEAFSLADPTRCHHTMEAGRPSAAALTPSAVAAPNHPQDTAGERPAPVHRVHESAHPAGTLSIIEALMPDG